MMNTDLENMPTMGRPCPPWCDQEPGHPFDSVQLHEDGSGSVTVLGVRNHGSQGWRVLDEAGRPAAIVEVVSDESAERVSRSADALSDLVGPSTHSRPRLFLGEVDDLDAGQARELAAVLLEAAATLEALSTPRERA